MNDKTDKVDRALYSVESNDHKVRQFTIARSTPLTIDDAIAYQVTHGYGRHGIYEFTTEACQTGYIASWTHKPAKSTIGEGIVNGMTDYFVSENTSDNVYYGKLNAELRSLEKTLNTFISQVKPYRGEWSLLYLKQLALTIEEFGEDLL